MKLAGTIDIGLFYRHTAITIPIENSDRSQVINWHSAVDFKQGDEIVIDIKKKAKKRSLNANAYFWKLLNELSNKLHIPDRELYRELVRDHGVSTVITVSPEAKDAFINVWTNGKDSSGWFVEDRGDGTLKAYQGTSTYNTQQMSRIIDALVEECKEQGIETMTPDELLRLKASWGK